MNYPSLPSCIFVPFVVKDRRGFSMPFYALFFAIIIVPIFALSMDIVRVLYVQTHLQTAVDAAAEAGAAFGYDVPYLQQNGDIRFRYTDTEREALSIFETVVAEADRVQYVAEIQSVTPDDDANTVTVVARARLFPVIRAITGDFWISATATSETRDYLK